MHSKIIAEDGHWVLYGFLGGSKLSYENLMSTILFKRIHFIGSLLRNRSDSYKERLVAEVTTDVFPLFRDSIIFPLVGAKFTLDFEKPEDCKIMDQAHLLMEKNKSVGRIVVCFE